MYLMNLLLYLLHFHLLHLKILMNQKILLNLKYHLYLMNH